MGEASRLTTEQAGSFTKKRYAVFNEILSEGFPSKMNTVVVARLMAFTQC